MDNQESHEIHVNIEQEFTGVDYDLTEFQQIVMKGGLIATVRKTRGEDIDAACGQLVGKVQDRTKRSERIKLQMTDIYQLHRLKLLLM